MMRLLIFLRNLYHIFPRMLSVSDAIILILKLLSTHGVLNMLFMPQKRGTFLNHSLTTAEQLSINTNQHSIQYIWENITATRVQMESNFKINYVTIICNISLIMVAYTYWYKTEIETHVQSYQIKTIWVQCLLNLPNEYYFKLFIFDIPSSFLNILDDMELSNVYMLYLIGYFPKWMICVWMKRVSV